MGWLSKVFGGGGKPGYEVDETFVKLRAQVFSLRDDGDVQDANGIVAILMETGHDDYCYTVAAVADGSLSLYLSNGGGTIGTGAWRQVGEMTRNTLSGTPRYLEHFQPTDEYPLPGAGRTGIYVVRPGRVLAAHHDEADLGNDRLPLSPLFHRLHQLIATIRHVSELKEKEPPLVFAAEMDETEMAREALADGAAPDLESSSGTPVLGVAARSGATSVVELLVDAGANVGIRVSGHHGGTSDAPLLCLAAGRGELEMASLLLEHGARIDDQDATGLTALHVAAYTGQVAMADLLLLRGAAIEARESSGYTPLMMAANGGQAACAGLLLERGAQPNATDDDGSTPVMFAAQHAHGEVVELLLAKGADPKVEGSHGLSAIDFARQNDHAALVKLMQR